MGLPTLSNAPQDITPGKFFSEWLPAQAISKGEQNPQAAFFAGNIRISGDMGLLMQLMPLIMA